jgi:hypothetical protein
MNTYLFPNEVLVSADVARDGDMKEPAIEG